MNVQTEQPTAKTAMLIRKPVTEVFEAFINPDIWHCIGSSTQ
jgi:hypothetical protein